MLAGVDQAVLNAMAQTGLCLDYSLEAATAQARLQSLRKASEDSVQPGLSPLGAAQHRSG